jgi:RND family efflux transporter MFP subunit
MTLSKSLIAGLSLVGLVCAFIWFQGRLEPKVPAGMTMLPGGELAKMQTVKAESSRMVGEVTVSGSVVSRETAKVAARIMGYVVELNVDAGSLVKKGHVMLRLDPKELTQREAQAAAALESAKAELTKNTNDFERFKVLFENQSVAKKDYDDATARFETSQAAAEKAEAALDQVRTQLSYAKVTAPFDGIVSTKDVNLGDLAEPGKPLLTLYPPGSLELVAAVGEQYTAYVVPGSTVTVMVDSIGLKQGSSIREVVPQRDEKTRTVTVKAPLTQYPGLGPGLYGTLTFHTRGGDAVTVPAGAVQTVGQLESVQVLEGEKLKIRHVKTGRRLDDGKVEIISGLEAGEEVVAP